VVGAGTIARVKLLRRALLAVSATGIIAAALRVRGHGGVPPRRGGWRELPLDPPR